MSRGSQVVGTSLPLDTDSSTFQGESTTLLPIGTKIPEGRSGRSATSYSADRLYTVVYKIPLRRFRDYWLLVRDPGFTKRRGPDVEAHEQRVFAVIARMIV